MNDDTHVSGTSFFLVDMRIVSVLSKGDGGSYGLYSFTGA